MSRDSYLKVSDCAMMMGLLLAVLPTFKWQQFARSFQLLVGKALEIQQLNQYEYEYGKYKKRSDVQHSKS